MKRIFIDPAKCDGCKNCTLACMASHQDLTPRKGSLAEIRQAVYALDLTDPATQSRNRIISDGEGGYSPIFCRHCGGLHERSPGEKYGNRTGGV